MVNVKAQLTLYKIQRGVPVGHLCQKNLVDEITNHKKITKQNKP